MTTSNIEVVREICRTLIRLEQTELVAQYTSVIIGLARNTYGNELGIDYKEVPASLAVAPLTPTQTAELSSWIMNQPWYVFSLVVGLAKGDENMAWGLAYG